MKKELKDYLHLYFGCECLLDNECIGILIGMNSRLEDNDIEMVCFIIWDKKDEDWTVYNDDGKFSRIKPILRPLSDIDAQEVLNCTTEMFTEMFASTDKKEFLKMFDNKEDSEYRCGFTAYVSAINWFRKNGFDVDGLIEAGLAIDKSTLKTNS